MEIKQYLIVFIPKTNSDKVYKYFFSLFLNVLVLDGNSNMLGAHEGMKALSEKIVRFESALELIKTLRQIK